MSSQQTEPPDLPMWRDFVRTFETRIVAATQDSNIFNVPEVELNLFNVGLHGDVLQDPVTTIETAETVLEREYKAPIRFGLVELATKIPISRLRAEHLNTYVSIPCIVQKIYEVKQRVVMGVWMCARCGAEHHRLNNDNQYLMDEPRECPHCSRKSGQTSFKLLEDRCDTEDIQFLEVQEQPEGMMGRHQPSTLECVVRPHLVRTANPGDRLVLNGVLKSVIHQKNGKKSAIMSNRLVVYAIEKSREEMDEHLTPDDVDRIKELSKQPDIIDTLARSILPGVQGLHHVKKGLTLQLFGGVPFKMKDMPEIRGDIHMMLLGDPGIAKTQMLRQIVQLHPRGFYADGGSSSKAGMTAAAVKTENGSFAVEAGACVLADMGFVALDEIDKMGTEDSARLNEVLESQRCTVRKAGTQVELNARCTVLSAANPKHKRFDRFSPIAPQVQIVDATTLDRFDVVYLIKDNAGEAERGETVRFLLSTGTEQGPMMRQRDIDVSTIRKYVAYARERVHPVLSSEAEQYLFETYMTRYKIIQDEMLDGTAGIDMGYRKVLALKRLAQASARIRLSEVVNLDDAQLAVAVMFDWSLDVAWQRLAGEMSLDIIGGKKDPYSYDYLRDAYQIAKEIQQASLSGNVTRDDLIRRLKKMTVYKGKEDKVIEMLTQKGWLITIKVNTYRAE